MSIVEAVQYALLVTLSAGWVFAEYMRRRHAAVLHQRQDVERAQIEAFNEASRCLRRAHAEEDLRERERRCAETNQHNLELQVELERVTVELAEANHRVATIQRQLLFSRQRYEDAQMGYEALSRREETLIAEDRDIIVNRILQQVSRENMTEAIARAYAYPSNSGKVVDITLVSAIIAELIRLFHLSARVVHRNNAFRAMITGELVEARLEAAAEVIGMQNETLFGSRIVATINGWLPVCEADFAVANSYNVPVARLVALRALLHPMMTPAALAALAAHERSVEQVARTAPAAITVGERHLEL